MGPSDRKKIENQSGKNSSYSLNLFSASQQQFLYHTHVQQWLKDGNTLYFIGSLRDKNLDDKTWWRNMMDQTLWMKKIGEQTHDNNWPIEVSINNWIAMKRKGTEPSRKVLNRENLAFTNMKIRIINRTIILSST